MAASDDPRCQFTTAAVPESIQALLKALEPTEVLEYGCRVKRHPGCCVLCAVNEDCRRIPVHVNCRCTREFYMMRDLVVEP